MWVFTPLDIMPLWTDNLPLRINNSVEGRMMISKIATNAGHEVVGVGGFAALRDRCEALRISEYEVSGVKSRKSNVKRG